MLSDNTLVSAISVLVKKIFTKNRSDVHYFLTDFNMNKTKIIKLRIHLFKLFFLRYNRN